MARKKWLIVLIPTVLGTGYLSSREFDSWSSDRAALSAVHKDPIAEHVFGGLPGDDSVLVRNGFVLAYNPDFRVPSWVAYRIQPDYLIRPERKGKFARFRPDPDLTNPVGPKDYTGWFRITLLENDDAHRLQIFKAVRESIDAYVASA